MMQFIQAVYERGVFRPTDPVDLPKHSLVEFEPRLVAPKPAADPSATAIYEILSRSYETGETDLAARHNEHQP
jgi:predicted DNA-binding antitoxin AbrB/MazE fold protein